MPSNLTGSTIADTFDQLLHIDGGPEATPKTVHSGTGVATAMKLGTVSVEFDNIKIDGNTISSTNSNGDITFAPAGAGAVVIPKVTFSDATQARTALGLGSAALSNANVFATAAQGLLADSALQPGDPISVAFGNVTGRAYGIFYDLSGQIFTANTPTLVEFDTTGIATGVVIANSTRITFAAAGVYEISCRFQFINADNTDHNADIWFRLNGSDISYSASELVVPKAGDGGVTCHAITGIVQVTAGQYLEAVISVENAGISLHHVGPITSPYNRPDVPSAIIVVNRIA